jgi:hypothetical protein
MSEEEKRREARIQELEREIADLKARWPKHSVPPAMLIRLEELEEELVLSRSPERSEGSVEGLERLRE